MQNSTQLYFEAQPKVERASFMFNSLQSIEYEYFSNFSARETVNESSLNALTVYRMKPVHPEPHTSYKAYSSEFLRSLRYRCRGKLEGIPSFLIKEITYSRSFLLSLRSSCNGEVESVPDFLKKTPITPPVRHSQDAEPRNNAISTREEVTLQEAENAWRPSNLAPANSDGNLEVYKKFRSVLNKLTPEKFEKLLQQLLELDFSTEERATEVVGILYEKAVSEQGFSELYARLCKELPADNFRMLLVAKCRAEFKKIYAEAAEADQKTRNRHVGNVRFVGELYKQGLLTRHIVTTCVERLGQNENETNLECLCKLLRTVGWAVEIKEGYNLSECFFKLQLLSTNLKLSSRIRFMIRDVIDLRMRQYSLEK